uniref:Uncharacterized protein n=1 Tax=Calidris pygmaea TaxID=425635 RepID=A0A8C3JFX3_9CHAR
MYRKHSTICLCFFKLRDTSHRFWTQDVTTPVTTDLTVKSYLIVSVIVVGLHSLHQLCKGSLILPVGDRFSSMRSST